MKTRNKPNWNEAFVSYCTPTLGGRNKSYGDIAIEFDTCVRTVERVGSRERWFERRCEVGVSKISKYLQERYDISVLIYNTLFRQWIAVLNSYDKLIENSLYGDTKMTPRDMLQFTKGLSVVTDQLLNLIPKPSYPDYEALKTTVTPEDEELLNKFIGK